MRSRRLSVLSFFLLLATTRASAQAALIGEPSGLAVSAIRADSTASPKASRLVHPGGVYWQKFAAGFAASILLHEAGHVGSSLAFGGRPSFGFDRARPTVFANLPYNADQRERFVFSSAGLTLQSLLDEMILDVPHGRGAAFERGILAGGIGTTLFYITLGRNGRVSDVQTMSHASGMSKNQISLIYGGIAAMHMVRIAHDGRYANFFARPGVDGMFRVGVDIK
jgi:hypothetical protein